MILSLKNKYLRYLKNNKIYNFIPITEEYFTNFLLFLTISFSKNY